MTRRFLWALLAFAGLGLAAVYGLWRLAVSAGESLWNGGR
jgi:hypothetical protein